MRQRKPHYNWISYVAGTGLEHGYMEDIIVHPDYQRRGVGQQLVKELLNESIRRGLTIVTLTYSRKHKEFYEKVRILVYSGRDLAGGGRKVIHTRTEKPANPYGRWLFLAAVNRK
ncbi:GNAT family N-acetyltransferase [Paenibacillus rhizoplanae]